MKSADNSKKTLKEVTQLLEQREAELAVINSVQEGLVREMDIQGIYELIGDRIRELFDAQVVTIATFDHDKKTEHFRYLLENEERISPDPRPMDKIRQRIASTKKPIFINENLTDELSKLTGEKPEAVPGTAMPKSILFMPLLHGDQAFGYVSLQNIDRENAFSDSDVLLLGTLSNSMSVALENARLFSETEQRNAELAVINSVQEALVSEIDIQLIYNLVGDRIRELLDAQVVTIGTFDHDKAIEHIRYLVENGERIYPDPRPLDKIRQRIIKTQKLVFFNENVSEALTTLTGEVPKAVPGTRMPKSILFVPLAIADHVIGYVSLQNIDRENAFSDSDVRLLSTLANSMSVALENARLFSETDQRNAELAVINSVQEGLVAEMDMQGIYDLVGDRIRNLFDAQVTIIVTFDMESRTEYFQFLFEDGDRLFPRPRKYDKLREKIINEKKTLLINENADERIAEINGQPHKAIPGTKTAKSALYVPLFVGDSVRGYVSLQNLDKEHAFNDSDVRLLNTLSNSMSVALENARLFNETEQRNAELAVINSVQEGLVAEMDMQGIYDLVGDRIRDLFDAQVAAIATFDHDKKTEHFRYLYENGERLRPAPRPFDKIRQRIINTHKMLVVNEDTAEVFTTITGEPPKAVPGTSFPKSMLFVPLSIGDSVRGYVSLQNLDKEHAFSESDVRLLNTLANSMSVALENARLFNETEQRNAELAVITSVQQGLVAEMDLKGIYELVGERIRQLFDAQVTGIYTFNHQTGMEHFEYLFEDGDRLYPKPRPLDKVRMKLIEDKELIWINENAAEEYTTITGTPAKAVPGTEFPKSVLFVPMVIGDNVRGHVSLQNLDHENAFSESDVRLLSTLVNSMSVALENARLFNETTRLLAETEQRNAELAVINSVQEGLVREMDLQAIYTLVGNRICEVLRTQTLLIRTFDHDKNMEIWDYAIENGVRLYNDPRPFIWANAHLIKTREPLLINEDYVETARKYGDKESGVSKGLPPKSAIFVPMMVGDVVIGSVSLQNVEREHAFTESDVRLLSTLTNSMSVALENARLFNETTRLLAETEKRAAELHTVNNISRALVSQLEFDTLIKLIGEQMKETFKADIVYLALHDRETDMIHFPYYYGDSSESRPFGNGITEKIMLSQEPLLINQKLEEAFDKLKAERKGSWVESFLGVPIIAGKKSIGVISVQSKEQENRFNEDDQRLLTTIAANVGVAMQNAEAYQKLQAALVDLGAAQEQLVQQEKLASLGQLTAGIAHEIKNPLNFVNNFSELSMEMLTEARDEVTALTEDKKRTDLILEIFDDIQANLRKIHDHGTRADGIVKSMLLHSRGGSGKIVPTDLNELVKEYVNLSFHGMRAGKNPINVDIKLELDKNVNEVPLIVEDFSRVILNLSNNAFDAMRDKEVAIRGTEQAEPYHARLTVRTKKLNGKTVIEVEDNGPGIPDDIKSKVLQPFFTTKKGTEGTGLGLSITHDIIKAHGGEMSVESKPGETRFIMSLNAS